MDMEAVIALGLLDGDRITINDGATVTCTETPSVLMGNVLINEGELHIDGLNISAGNVINFVGEGGLIDASNDQVIEVKGQGKLKITGDWFDIGTTDGTDGQVIDLSTATGSALWEKGGADFCVDVIPMIQIETGREIEYTGGLGVLPEVGDWLYLSSDRTVMGKIKEIKAGSSVENGFFVVWCLTGEIATYDAIQVRKVVDNNGADLQMSWDGFAVWEQKEAGVYMEFGNARFNATNHIAAFGNGYGGLVFHHAFQGTDLTLGSNTGTGIGGFKAPSGCNIRVPNVVVNTSSLEDESGSTNPYANGLAFGCGHNATETEWYGLEFSAGGEIDLSTCNWGNAYALDATAYRYDAEYVGAVINIGTNTAGAKTTFDHVVVCQSTELKAAASLYEFGGIKDAANGTDISFCMVVAPATQRMAFGGETSFNVHLNDCIWTCAGQDTLATSTTHGYYFNKVTNASLKNCMYFGNNHAEQDKALNVNATPNTEIEMFMLSMTQDYTEATREYDAMFIGASPNTTVVGVEFIGNGTPGNNVFYLSDQTDTKIRAIGMIDDKVDLGASGEYVFNISGASGNVDIARVWFDKTTTIAEEFFVIAAASGKMTIQNCSSKYAAGVVPRGVENTRVKGLHAASGTPGGGTGWEDNLLAVYGVSFHDGFKSDTSGTIACLMTTPSDAINETTIVAGNPLFFKDGDLNMKAGDIIDFEMAYFTKGHTGFTGLFSAVTGTSGWFADEWSNVTLEFQWMLEGGAWNGTWLDTRTASNWTSISGAIEAGFKLKHRFTATGTQLDMSMLLIDTTTTLTAQRENFYVIDKFSTNTISEPGLIAGTRVQLYNTTQDIEVDNTILASTGYEYAGYEGAIGDVMRLRTTYTDGVIATLPTETLFVIPSTNGGIALKVEPAVDAIYNANAIDGSTVTEFATDFPNIEIDISDPDGSTTAPRLYAWYAYTLTTEDGIRYWYGGLVAEDETNYRVITDVLDLRLQNTSAIPVQIYGARLYRDDTQTILVAGTGPIQLDPLRAYIAPEVTSISEDLAYGGIIHIDTGSSYSGSTFPVGTESKPVNNLADAVAIGIDRGIRTFHLDSDLVLDRPMNGYVFDGSGKAMDLNNQMTNGSTFKALEVTGTQNSFFSMFIGCRFKNFTNFAGMMQACFFTTTTPMSLRSGISSVMSDCRSAIAGTSSPVFDYGNGNIDLSVRAYSGGLRIINSDDADNTTTLEYIAGKFNFEETNTAGLFEVRGVVDTTNINGGGAIVNTAGVAASCKEMMIVSNNTQPE